MHSVAADGVAAAGSAAAAVVVREAAEAEAELVVGVEVLGPAADFPAAVAGTRWEVRRRSVVRVAVVARRRDQQRQPLDPTQARVQERGRMSVAEMSARGISRTSEPERDRVLRRCRRLGLAMERGRALDQVKALRIVPEQVRALPLDRVRVLVLGKGSRIGQASRISRRGCRDSVRVVRVRDCRIKELIGRRRSKVGKGT